MPKLAFLIVGLALAGCASTSEWRALRLDGASKSTFEESAAVFRQELPQGRRLYFDVAITDLWTTAALKAQLDLQTESNALEAASRNFLAQIDGLGYDEIVSLAGPRAKKTYVIQAMAAASGSILTPMD